MATKASDFRAVEPIHFYNADADVLSADITQPIDHRVPKQAHVHLPKDGRYTFRQARPFKLKGILSYEGGYAQVAGHRSTKMKGGFATLTTAVVEGLNVLDVLTADRVVGQISTVHPPYGEGQVPSVTFLGTRFENLRIGGHKVDVDRHLEILGQRKDDTSFFEKKEVQQAIAEQSKGLPEWAQPTQQKQDGTTPITRELNCSLVNKVHGAPGDSFGHVIDVPHFGKIFLAELKVDRKPPARKDENETYTFHLRMIRLEMGCLASGSATAGAMDSNGTGGKGGGP